MAEYNKQTVANLRALLKDRGIPSTGLTRKAQIIERLEQHDAETANAEPEVDAQLDGTNDDAEAEAREVPPESEPATDAAPAKDEPREEDGDVEPQEDDGGAQDQAMPDAPDEATDNKAAETENDGQADKPAGSTETDEPKTVDAQPAKEESQQAPPSAEASAPQSHETSQQMEGRGSLATKEPSLSASSELPKEEAKTRKRRSVTPPVNVEDTRKRLKLDSDHVPTVHLKEDGPAPEVEMQDAALKDTVNVDEKSAEQVSPVETREDAEGTSSARINKELEGSASAGVDEAQNHEEKDHTAAGKVEQVTDDSSKNHHEEIKDGGEPSRVRSTSPKPHKDARYQSLLPPAGESTSMPSAHPDAAEEDDDRAISPALHPATRGLYIRNFMRPLQPTSLKNHLTSIASPPSSSEPDPNALELFHLDPIRTHVLALFDSITAASRVRSSLHEAVWPPERSRKPLWADFIPDNKVSEWIEREEKESGGSSRMSKRWEVVYEPADVEGGVRASHREVGAPSSQQLPRGPAEPTAPASPPRGARPAPPDSPRSTKAAAPAGPATEKSFVALDKLFESTTAKPKLYFLPVSADLATRRLDELRRCSSRNWRPSDRPGAGAERRYTFDDGDVLVDAGPDAEGVRGRGAVRYRGGGPGGPRGGGGFRDRGWGVQTGMGGPPPDYGRRRW